MSNKMKDEIEKTFRLIRSETVKATASLFYLLQGIGLIHRNPFPIHPDLKVFPILPGQEINSLFLPDQGITQAAFKAWVCEVFDGIWEYHRNHLKKVFGENTIPPETDFMGDFRHVRNDFIHAGRATKKGCGRCKVLNWFKPPESIIFKLDHVLEFLHQMDFITQFGPSSAFQGHGWNLRWDIDPKNCNSSNVRLLSIRKSTDSEGEGGSTRHMLSCIFDDGIFGSGPIDSKLSDDEFMKGEINEEGDVVFYREETETIKIKKSVLYSECLNLRYKYKDGVTPENETISGMYGPIFTIRR